MEDLADIGPPERIVLGSPYPESNSNVVGGAFELQETRTGDAVQTNEQAPSTDRSNKFTLLTESQKLGNHGNQEFIAHFSRQFGSDGVLVVVLSSKPCDLTSALSYLYPSLSARKFHECSTSFLLPGVWATVGFCGSGFADDTPAGTHKRQYSDKDSDAFNTARKPRADRKSVRSGNGAKFDCAADSDSDVVVGLQRFESSKARHRPAAGDSESDSTDKLTGARQGRGRGWTGEEEDFLQQCVEKGVSWSKTARKLNRTPTAVSRRWVAMMQREEREERRERSHRKGRDSLPLGRGSYAFGDKRSRKVTRVAKP